MSYLRLAAWHRCRYSGTLNTRATHKSKTPWSNWGTDTSGGAVCIRRCYLSGWRLHRGRTQRVGTGRLQELRRLSSSTAKLHSKLHTIRYACGKPHLNRTQSDSNALTFNKSQHLNECGALRPRLLNKKADQRQDAYHSDATSGGIVAGVGVPFCNDSAQHRVVACCCHCECECDHSLTARHHVKEGAASQGVLASQGGRAAGSQRSIVHCSGGNTTHAPTCSSTVTGAVSAGLVGFSLRSLDTVCQLRLCEFKLST